MSKTTLNVEGLDKIIKALKISNAPYGRVGILGSKTTRGMSAEAGEKQAVGPTNAEIGAAHEYGTTKLPQRSFLRIPITDHLSTRMKDSGLSEKAVLKQVIKSGSVVPWLQKVVIVAEGIVLDAFDSGGFGKWVPSDMTKKKNEQTLVETQQLRNSITSEVVE